MEITEITQEMIQQAALEFDGTCPFPPNGGECSWMSVLECNKCHRSQEYRDHKEI